MLLAVFAIRYLVNQVVLGVVLNLFALGLTGFGYHSLMQSDPNSYNAGSTLNPIKIPLLGDIPVIGPALFDATSSCTSPTPLIVAVDIALFRTRWGLRTRAVGEHPKAADTVGIKVLRHALPQRDHRRPDRRPRRRDTSRSAARGSSTSNISSGQGLHRAGRGDLRPVEPARRDRAPPCCSGSPTQLQTMLSIVGTPVTIPSNFLAMAPYLATVIAVAGLVGRVQAPAADGEPYVEGLIGD